MKNKTAGDRIVNCYISRTLVAECRLMGFSVMLRRFLIAEMRNFMRDCGLLTHSEQEQ